MSNEVSIREGIKNLLPVTTKIDEIVEECLPITQTEAKGVVDALILAKGISELKKLFSSNEAIKATILNMKDSALGFRTDRSNNAIELSKKTNKPLKAYEYSEITECCINALLKGYRLTDNEFNIIAGNFYPAKNGKFRKIVETKNLTDFTFSTTPPVYKSETRLVNNKPWQVQYAEVETFANWKIKGKTHFLGNYGNRKAQDSLIFKIKVNQGMGDDAVIGKALSKLFSRVLMRITGKIYDEATEIINDDKEVIEIKKESNEELSQRIKEKPVQEEREVIKTDEFTLAVKSLELQGISELEICAYCYVEDIHDVDEKYKGEIIKLASDIETGIISPDEFRKKAGERLEIKMKEAK